MTLVAGAIAVSAVIAWGIHLPATAPSSGRATIFTPLTSWTSWSSPWNSNAHSFPPSPPCSYGYNTPSLSNLNSAGQTTGDVGSGTASYSTCTPETIWESAWAGTHISGYYTPTSTGIYTFSASWTISIHDYLWAQCGSGTGNGVSLTNFATTDVNLSMAIWDNTQGSGQTVPNAVLTVFHLDSRAAVCASYTWGNPNAAYVDLSIESLSITETCKAYLLSTDSYIPRASIQIYQFAYGVSGGFNAESHIDPYSMGGTLATLNSISVT